MFAGWGSWVARFRWPVLTVALVAVLSGGLWGLGVFGQLTEGGYNDPHSESSRAAAIVQQALGTPSGEVVAIYTPTRGKIGDAALTKQVKARLAALPKSDVTAVSSYWQSKSSSFAAKDKSSAVAVITLAGPDDGAKLDQYREIKDSFSVTGATVQLAGAVPLNDASSSRSTSDLGKAELISLPITLILLLFIFGSLVAAALPVLVGGLAVLGSFGILHLIAGGTQVNSFAVNVASLLGLGMAIDYGLFLVGRFREELASGRSPDDAVRRTVGTAGRTVLFSATLLMIALSGLLLFPQSFLKSLAYGGLSAVGLAAVLSLTLLPALLAVIGRGVDKLPIRLPVRGSGGLWARVAGGVLRRPVLVALPILAVLLLLASPGLGVQFGDSDERILPAGDPSRAAVQTLKASYPQFANNGVQIVLRGTQNTGPFAAAVRAVPGIDQLAPTIKTPEGAILTATLKDTDPYSASARDVVEAIRDLPVPAGGSLLVGGTTARNQDSLKATAAKLPLMIGLLAGATLILMFLAFGSILLPIKAVLMSAISLSATFGVLVWIFVDGHLSGLLNITPAPLEAGTVILMAAVVFGLSTDYEVFLLSRMVEARTRGASTVEAVTTGLARTGRVISAAALLLIVVTGAFALSAVTTMRFVGIGMIVALLLDATVVRMLLVPAVLGLLGDAAWWAPGPLRRLQQRAGLAEYAGEEAPALSGRHAAPDDTVIFALPSAPSAAAAALAAASSPAATSSTSSPSPRLQLPVPELMFRDEEPPGSARTSGLLASLPRAADPTVVFPAYADGTDKQKTVRIELEPSAAEDAAAAETVDAELVDDGPAPDDLEATGILTLEPATAGIADAEVVPEEPVTPAAAEDDRDAESAVEPVDAPAADEPATVFETAAVDEPAAGFEAVAVGKSSDVVAAPAAEELPAEPSAAEESTAVVEASDAGEPSEPAVPAPPTEAVANTATAEPGDGPDKAEPAVAGEPVETPASIADGRADEPFGSIAEPSASPSAAEPLASSSAAERDGSSSAAERDGSFPAAERDGSFPAGEPDGSFPVAEPLASSSEVAPDASLAAGDQGEPVDVAGGASADEPEPATDDVASGTSGYARPASEHGSGVGEVAESDTPLFAGAGADSYAALFPELFNPAPEPAINRYTDWSATSGDAFFAPAAADPFLYRTEVPAAEDERYVTLTPAEDNSAPEVVPPPSPEPPSPAEPLSSPEPSSVPEPSPAPAVGLGERLAEAFASSIEPTAGSAESVSSDVRVGSWESFPQPEPGRSAARMFAASAEPSPRQRHEPADPGTGPVALPVESSDLLPRRASALAEPSDLLPWQVRGPEAPEAASPADSPESLPQRASVPVESPDSLPQRDRGLAAFESEPATTPDEAGKSLPRRASAVAEPAGGPAGSSDPLLQWVHGLSDSSDDPFASPAEEPEPEPGSGPGPGPGLSPAAAAAASAEPVELPRRAPAVAESAESLPRRVPGAAEPVGRPFGRGESAEPLPRRVRSGLERPFESPAVVPEPLPKRVPAAAELAAESISEPVAESVPGPAPEPVSEAAARTAVFEAPTFEPSSVPVFDPAAATVSEAAPTPEPASGSVPGFDRASTFRADATPSSPVRPAPAVRPAPVYRPEPEPAVEAKPPVQSVPAFNPEPAYRTEPEPPAGTRSRAQPTPAFEPPATEERRRPSDLSEVAAAWRQVIERRALPERPADLAGYVGHTPRGTDEPEPSRSARPTDLGSYAAARPSDRGEITGGWRPAVQPGGQDWEPVEERRRPEHLGDQPPRRRPATLADHLPAQRRPEPQPEEGPTRDLSGYGEQEESPEVRR